MALPEGTRVFVAYDVPPPLLYHERYVLAACANGRGFHMVLTPDNDVYAEQFVPENDDILNYRIAVGGALPAGCTEANTYRIRQLPGPDLMNQFRRDASQAAAAMGPPAGAGLVGAAVGGVGAAAAVGGADEEVWIRVETEAGKERGEILTMDGTEVIHGDRGLKNEDGKMIFMKKMKRGDIDKYKGAEATGDARLLSMTFQDISRAERQWRDVSKDIKQEDFKDWSMPGPRTTEWCVRFLNRRNGGPMDHHRWWTQNHSLKPDNWGVAEHDNLSKALDKLGRFDGLDLSNLAGVEVMFRRLQLIEYVYSDRGPGGGKGSSKSDKKTDVMTGVQQYEATIFAGAHKEFGDVMVAPSLLEYVAKEVESEAAVLKQVRKAREERAAASK